MPPTRSGISSTMPKFPTIDLGERKGPGDDGKLLRLPDDFTPVPDIQLDTMQRERNVRQLLREEEERARDAGMTIEELRHYQDLLQKRFF